MAQMKIVGKGKLRVNLKRNGMRFYPLMNAECSGMVRSSRSTKAVTRSTAPKRKGFDSTGQESLERQE